MSIISVSGGIIVGAGLLLLFSNLFPTLNPFDIFTKKQVLSDSDNSQGRDTSISIIQQIDNLLFQARAEIAASEFILFSMSLGVGFGAIYYWATRAILPTVVAFLGGGVIYYLFLIAKREKAQMEYESVQPQVINALFFGFQAHGTSLEKVISEVSDNGPAIVREDWKIIKAALTVTASNNHERVQEVVTKRASPALAVLVDIFITNKENVAAIPGILEDIKDNIIMDVEDTRESVADISSPKRELSIVTAVPFIAVLLLSQASEANANYYRSVEGQFIIIISWIFAIAIYVIFTGQAKKAINPRPKNFLIPESRKEASYKPDKKVASNKPDGLDFSS